MIETPLGSRILEGPEDRLVRRALWALLADLEAREEKQITPIRAYNQLPRPQQFALMAHVAPALFRREVVSPTNKSTWTVAAIAVIFDRIKYEVVCDLNHPRRSGSWLNMLVLACVNARLNTVPTKFCMELPIWFSHVDQMRDGITEVEFDPDDGVIDPEPPTPSADELKRIQNLLRTLVEPAIDASIVSDNI